MHTGQEEEFVCGFQIQNLSLRSIRQLIYPGIHWQIFMCNRFLMNMTRVVSWTYPQNNWSWTWSYVSKGSRWSASRSRWFRVYWSSPNIVHDFKSPLHRLSEIFKSPRGGASWCSNRKKAKAKGWYKHMISLNLETLAWQITWVCLVRKHATSLSHHPLTSPGQQWTALPATCVWSCCVMDWWRISVKC